MLTQEKLDSILENSKLLALLADRRKNALTFYEESLVFGFGGGLFKADALFINLITVLGTSLNEAVVVDINKNPIRIDDLKELIKETLIVYHEATNRYHAEITEINSLRKKQQVLNVK